VEAPLLGGSALVGARLATAEDRRCRCGDRVVCRGADQLYRSSVIQICHHGLRFRLLREVSYRPRRRRRVSFWTGVIRQGLTTECNERRSSTQLEVDRQLARRH
jgi:hypothetical protein